MTALSVAEAGRKAARDGPGRGPLLILLGVSLAVVGALTLTSEGTGWAWGAPLVELRWYIRGLDSPSTLAQLVGNFALLMVPAVLAVLVWPRLRRIGLLGAASVGVAATIELLQRILPLGRVVSPIDALLNAVGAVVAGLLTAVVVRDRQRRRLNGEGASRPSRTLR